MTYCQQILPFLALCDGFDRMKPAGKSSDVLRETKERMFAA